MKGCIMVWIERRIIFNLHALLVWSRPLWPPLVDETKMLQATLFPLIYNLQACKRGTFFSCMFLLTNRANIYDIQWALIYGCLLVHLGQKIANALFASSCFFFIYIVSNYKEKVCNISLLIYSNMLLISCLIVEVEGEDFVMP